ncbi:MAG: hypothetical protein HZB39_21215, partial [Planctomycetes bacterium]|nr:hypothetical protein [Planctomycetota bacterium]
DLHKDLLGALDGQLLLMNDTTANFEGGAGEEEDFEMQGLYTVVVGLRDPASFEAMLERVLRSRGLHAARKTAEYRGTKVRSMSVLVAELHYAFVAEGMVIGIGPTGADNVRKVVDQSLARAEGQASAAPDAAIAKRLALLAPGWRDLGTSSLNLSTSAMDQVLQMAFADLERDADEGPGEEALGAMQKAIEAYLGLARRFDLLASVSSMKVESGRLRIESIQ